MPLKGQLRICSTLLQGVASYKFFSIFVDTSSAFPLLDDHIPQRPYWMGGLTSRNQHYFADTKRGENLVVGMSTSGDAPLGGSLPSPPTTALSLSDSCPSKLVDELGTSTAYSEVIDEFGYPAYESFCEGLGQDNFRWIRIEKQPDKCLRNISKREVLRKITEVREEQTKYGRSDLYPRDWEIVGCAGEPAMFEEQENRINRTNNRASSNVVSVMQFNTLAEGLSSGPAAKNPFQNDPANKRAKVDMQDYGGFTSVPFPEVCLDFSRRRWRLLETILRPNGTVPDDLELPFDLIALEEVDRFHGFFAPVLTLFGYESVFMPKFRSPGVFMGWYSDGCCLFWKQTIFDLVSEHRFNFKVGSQGAMIVVLRHRQSQKSIVVAITHLKAQQNKANEKIRYMQVDELLDRIEITAVQSAACDGIDVKDVPILILGDFNADPPAQNFTTSDSAVGLVLNGRTGAKKWFSKLYRRLMGKKTMRFRSAYEINPPGERFYTTWKTRGPSTSKRIIDYIFHSERLKCKAILPVPSPEELEQNKLPGLRNPSDHLMIAAKFQI